MLPKIIETLYKDHVTNEDVRREIQAAIGEYDELQTLVKKWTKVVWPYLKVFWLSKGDSAGYSARAKEENVDKRRGGKTISRIGRDVLCKLN